MFELRTKNPKDQPWITQMLTEHWGSALVVSRGKIRDASQLPGFVAVKEGKPAGLATFQIEGVACELVTLDSWQENLGIGTALIEAVKQEALQAGCTRLWLITTNDNLPALGFYQKRGFHLAAVYPNALDASRKIKPSISKIGLHGIPLRDEIELALTLSL